MEIYTIIIKPSVEKDFRNLSKADLSKVFSAIKNLAEEPFPNRVAKLEGTDRTYRLRVGNYRIVMRFKKPKKQSRFCMSGIVGKFIETFKLND